jgi:transposase
MSDSVRYSEAFKLTVIEGISTGRYKSIEEARRVVGIGGSVTIQKWLVNYGREDLLSKRVRIETVKERDEKKEMARRIKDLETALADAHIDCSLDRAFLQIACERLGMDIEAFKKKHALTLSDIRKMRGMK